MRSIGREAESARVNSRIDALKSDRLSKVHLAVVAPRFGGLSLFLDDLAEERRARGDIVATEAVASSLDIEAALARVNGSLASVLGESSTDGSIESLLRLGRVLRAQRPGQIAVVILDVAEALREIAVKADLRRSARSNPLLQKLRTIVNVLQDHEPPIAFVVGWDDRFREHAPDWHVGDVVQRYSVEVLFADFGIGRQAWPLFRHILESNGLEISTDYPGVCGSGLPAGALVHEAKGQQTTVIDGTMLRRFLLDLVSEQNRERVTALDWNLCERLCLKDEELAENPSIGPLAQINDAGKYVATREFYSLLGLVPPRDIVSFEERVRLRLEDADPTLEIDVMRGIASSLGAVDVSTLAERPRITLGAACVPQPLRRLETLLSVCLTAIPEPWVVETVTEWIAEGEQDPVLGAGRLALVAYHDPALKNTFARGVVERLKALGISNPRPLDGKGTATQARPLAGLLLVRLDSDQIVDAVWRVRDPRHEDELSEVLRRDIHAHYKSLTRYMPRLKPDAFPRDEIQELINATGAPVAVSGNAADRIRRLRLANPAGAGRFQWFWRDDDFLQWLSGVGSATASTAAGRFLLEPDDWPSIVRGIHAAYGDALVRLDGEVISAVDPAPLLEAQYLAVRRQLMDEYATFAPLAPSDQLDHWRTRLRAYPDNPSTITEVQSSIVRMWEDIASVRESKAVALQDRDLRAAELRELKQQLEKTEAVTSGLEAERTGFLQDVEAVIETPADLRPLIDRGARIHERLEDQVVQRQTRERRLTTVGDELRALEKNPSLKEHIEKVRAQAADPEVPAEQVVLAVERLKAAAESVHQEPSPANGHERTETFRNTNEDLTRLAAVCRRGRITAVEIQ
jgi:hypothetical protein